MHKNQVSHNNRYGILFCRHVAAAISVKIFAYSDLLHAFFISLNHFLTIATCTARKILKGFSMPIVLAVLKAVSQLV